MKSPLPVRRVMLFATTCVLLQHGGLVRAAANAEAAPAAAIVPALGGAAGARANGAAQRANSTADADPDTQGDVAELTRLIQSSTLTELRTTYNGGYGASLFSTRRI